MTDRYEPQIKKLLKDADRRESDCIRMYGGIEPHTEISLRTMRQAANTLRLLASQCYMAGIDFKITRVRK